MKEYLLSRDTFLDGIRYFKIDEKSIKSTFALAATCSEYDMLFEAIKKEDSFFSHHFEDEFMKLIQKIYLKKVRKTDSDICGILRNCNNPVEESIMRYLISTTFEDKSERLNWCMESLKLWKDNLAAAEFLNMNKKYIGLDNVSKLIDLDKYDFNLNKMCGKDDYGFEFIPLGGGNDVGANCYFMKVNDLHVIIDAGIKINGSSVENPNFEILMDNELIKKIDFVIITHAHLDHCGSILELYKLNKKMKFLMTEETYKLMCINLKSKGLDYEESYLLEEISNKIITLDFNYKLNIKDRNVSIELYPAGHILGAASVLIETEKCNVYVTGDFCLKDQMTVRGAELPEDVNIDVLITESTYRDRDECSKYINGPYAFGKYVRDKLNEGKTVLIPAFAIGRSQEIISLLNSFNENNDEKYRIYVDGSSIKVTEAYEELLEKKIAVSNLYYAGNTFYSSKEDFIREEVMNNKSCIVSSSGMLLDESASAKYAEIMLQDENSVCVLTGYQAYNTPGYNLKNQIDEEKRYITIDGKFIKIKSEIESFNLTAHAGVNDILSVEAHLKADNVIIVHGDYRGTETILENKLKKFNDVKIIQSMNNEKIKL